MNNETKNAITKYLQLNKINYPTIVVYCGNENNNYVHDCKLDVDTFNSILDKTQKISLSRLVYKRRTYSFCEMKKIIITKFKKDESRIKWSNDESSRNDNYGKKKMYNNYGEKEKNEEYFKMFPVKYFRQQNLVFVIYDYPKINIHEFPIICKYDYVIDESVTEFTHEKNGYFLKSYFCKSKYNNIIFELQFLNIVKKDNITEKENAIIDNEIENQMFVLSNFVKSVIN